MIPLILKAQADRRMSPFVVRLIPQDTDATADDAQLVEQVATTAKFDSMFGSIYIHGLDKRSCHGDVLYIDPARGVAHRWIRAASNHNTLLVTERCDQLCVMCSQPPKKYHQDLFPHFKKAISLAPKGATIGLSGGEPLIFKDQIFDLINFIIGCRPDICFHILTNGQHFSQSDLIALRVIPKETVLWGIPLYAPSADVHDEIVKKKGAFDTLLRSLSHLARAGSSIELRTVTMKPNVQLLSELARFIKIKTPFIDFWALMQLENIGYGRMNWNELFYDNSSDFTPISRALDIAKMHGITTKLYNFPLCTVPEHFRDLAPQSISDWKVRYLTECDHCTRREACAGFFEWYPDKKGFSKVLAL